MMQMMIWQSRFLLFSEEAHYSEIVPQFEQQFVADCRSSAHVSFCLPKMFFLNPCMSITRCQLTLSVEKSSHGYLFSFLPLYFQVFVAAAQLFMKRIVGTKFKVDVFLVFIFVSSPAYLTLMSVLLFCKWQQDRHEISAWIDI